MMCEVINFSVQFLVFNVQCTFYCVQGTVYSVYIEALAVLKPGDELECQTSPGFLLFLLTSLRASLSHEPNYEAL